TRSTRSTRSRLRLSERRAVGPQGSSPRTTGKIAMRAAAVLAVLAITATGGFAQPGAQAMPSLLITDTEGAAELVRAHRPLGPDRLRGVELEPFDLLTTGPDARVELAAGAGQAEIRVTLDGESAVTVHPAASPLLPAPPTERRTAIPSATTATLELLSGSLSVEPADAAAATVLFREGRVEAPGGTRVAVARRPLGGIRVEADGGRAAVHLTPVPPTEASPEIPEPSPRRLFAGRGRAVEWDPHTGVFENTDTRPTVRRVIPTAGGEAIEENLRRRAQLYDGAERAFEEAYREVIAAEPSVLRWMRAADTARRLDEETRATLEDPVRRLAAARRDFEPLFWEQIGLSEVLDPQALAPDLREERRVTRERLDTARHLLRLLHRTPPERISAGDP
ncbi:MAG: hypothetical protein ACLFMV_11325, partial [Spirochaetaceae bacterium]